MARLRATEPVSWLPALGGWLISRYDVAVQALRDPAVFTVDDPRFSTSRLVGPSMLSLDGAEHTRHREPFTRAFHPARAHHRFGGFLAAQTDRLISAIGPAGGAELRSQFAGPLTAAVIIEALGLRGVDTDTVLSWYAAIVSAVSDATAGQPVTSAGGEAFDRLRAAVIGALDDPRQPSLLRQITRAPHGLSPEETVSNAAVVMFGGIDTAEAMIVNAVRHLLTEPGASGLVCDHSDLLVNAVEESVRLEPAAALVDRYATGDVEIGGVQIRAGDRVSISIAGANRDPAVFADPDRFDIGRANARLNLAFAQGPHFCLGAQLARIQTRTAVRQLLDRLPGLRLDTLRPDTPRGLVFRKPPALHVRWTATTR